MGLPLRWRVGMALAVAVAFGLVAGLYVLHDPDVWWVAAVGRLTLERGALPVTNVFSFTEPDHPWLMHEWLLAVPYAKLMQTAGPGGFALAALGQTVAAILLLASFFHRETRSFAAFLFLVTVTLFLFGARFLTLRPTHVALLVALAFAVVAYRPRLGLARAALLTAIELLWTNVHGSFVIGVFLVAASMLAYPDEWRARGAATLSIVAVTFVNPFGLREHRFVLDYFLGRADVYRVIHEHVADFAPLYRISPLQEPLTFVSFAALLVLSAVALRTPGSRVRAAIALLLTLVAIKNVRHLDLAGVVSMVILTPTIDELCESGPRTSSVPEGRWLPVALWGAPLLVGLLAFGWRATRAPSAARFVTPDGTSGASWIEALDRVPSGARLFVPFNAGGVAIWFTATRDVRVFYDPRNDCYSAAVAEEAFELEFASRPATELTGVLTRHGTTHLVLPRRHPLARAMASGRDYVVTSVEGDLLVFTLAVP
jgi:hypothetical protein